MTKTMNYFEKQKIEEKIKQDINEINEYENEDYYVSSKFRQFLTHGEYNDNSLWLSYRYKILKEISEDKEFMSKLNFVLTNYVSNPTAK